MLDIIIEQNVMQGEARKTWQWGIIEDICDIRKRSYENLSILRGITFQIIGPFTWRDQEHIKVITFL